MGILSPFPCKGTPPVSLFLTKSGAVGFIEGQNLTVSCRDFAQHSDLSSEYAAELVKAKVDVIVAYGDAAIRAAQQATKTISILALTEDMVGSGFVNSLAAKWQYDGR